MTAREALDILDNSKAHPEYVLSIAYNTLENVIDELEELKKSDESKEQSSIDYYNEMRLLLAKNATAIEKAGGKVILMMTDSIFWQGKEDMIISDDVIDSGIEALPELEELKKSDECNEQSSIDYYNEMRKYKRELEMKDELLELYIHAFNIFTKRNEITIKLQDRLTLNEIFRQIKALEEEMK